MAIGSLFSGLVQGFGSSLGQGYERKRAQDEGKKQDMFRLLSSALMNDDDLPGSAKRTGLQQIGENYGVKIPDELIASLVPDVPIETDRFKADKIPQAHPVTFDPMPQSPITQAAPQQGGKIISDQQNQQLGTPPGAPQQQQGGAAGQATPQQGMAPMPRNPMVDQPQILGAQAPGAQSNAPVTQQYTSGTGSSYDELDLAMKQKQLEAQLQNPPSRFRERATASSLGMSRAQIAEMRTRRMQQEQRELETTMDQYQNVMKVQQAHQEQAYQMSMQVPLMKAHMDAISAAYGSPLSQDQKGRALGVGATGPERERELEAEDYRIAAAKPGTPEGQAAKARVDDRERSNTYKLSEIQKNMAQIQAQMQAMKDPMNNPKLVNGAKVSSAKAAASMWTLTDQQEYIEQRTQYWEQQLGSSGAGAPMIPGLDPQTAALIAGAKSNPQQLRALAVQKAQQDAVGYKQRLADLIFQYGFPSGDKVVTVNYVRRRAEEAQKQNLDPNAVWDYWKKNGTILDNNLDIWTP